MKGNSKKGLARIAVTVAATAMALLILTSIAGASVTLRAKGSTTVQPISAGSEVPFETDYPDVNLTVEGGGSGAGKTCILNNTCEIGNSSSNWKTGDDASTTYKIADTDDWYIARDAIAIIVRDNGTLDCLLDISKAQLKTIYEAESGITSRFWDSIDGDCPHQLIVPRARIIGSGTRQSLLDMVPITGTKEENTITATGQARLDGNPQMITAIEGNDYHVGYVGLGFIDDPDIRVIPVGGVTPSSATVQNGTYPMSRVLHMLTLKPSVDPDYMPRTQDYINWILSKDGQQIAENEGFVSIAPDWDVNVDHGANIGDVVAVGLHWNGSGVLGWIREDVNNDGGVNIGDVVAVGLQWNKAW